jgi:hypothetical protein
MDDAEIALIGMGFYKLSCEKRREIRKNAEILMFAQEKNQKPCEQAQRQDVVRENKDWTGI